MSVARRTYLDTSALLKLVIEENNSSILAEAVEDYLAAKGTLVTSLLTQTEAYCAIERRIGQNQQTQSLIEAVLAACTVVAVQDEDYLRAAFSHWGLRSADAIHLAVAIKNNCEQLLTYDVELGKTAVQQGILHWIPEL